MKRRLWYVVSLTLLVIWVSDDVLQVTGAKRSVSISDDLNDVVDDEEDEAWKEWGKPKKKKTSAFEFDPPDYDFENMRLDEIQNEMMKRHVGPTFGFVKLRLGGSRSADETGETARRWSKVLRTGSIEVSFMAVDLNTIMFTMEKGQNTLELKDFILDQEEAYEVKIGEQLFRRPGDPPLDEVVEMLRKGRSGGVDGKLRRSVEEESRRFRDEL